jgi:two-component system NarL family response regulator
LITVFLVDDHRVVRAGLAALLSLEPDLRVVGEAADGETAIAKCAELRPDVVVMDLKLPGIDGARATSAVLRNSPTTKVLAFSTLMGDESVYRALQAGALGYLMKDSSSDELVAAIRATHAGRRTIPATVAEALDRRLASDPLSAREVDVLRLVAAGRANREVGDELGLTENTVKGYLKTILSKLDAPDRTAAAIIAVQRGWIDL